MSTVIVTQGVYKVVLPMLPRHRTQKYIVVRADNSDLATQQAIWTVEDHRAQRGQHAIWIDSTDVVVETISEPVTETTTEQQERSDRARAIAAANRKRRA